jgi:predicted transcriptional regulator
MKPNSKLHNPAPSYLRSLIEGAGLSQMEVAVAIGISPRSMRHYLAGNRPIPYGVQFSVESLVHCDQPHTCDKTQ